MIGGHESYTTPAEYAFPQDASAISRNTVSIPSLTYEDPKLGLARYARSLTNSGRSLVEVSNRLPVEILSVGNGRLEARPTIGGLVATVEPIAAEIGRGGAPVSWGGYGGKEDPRAIDAALRTYSEKTGVRLWHIAIPQTEYGNYYTGFSNQALWEGLHGQGLEDTIVYKKEFWDGYTAVNKQVAESIMQQTGPQDDIDLQDYHLALVPHYMRELGANHVVKFHLHTPFAPVDAIRKIPHHAELTEALLSCNVVTMQTDYSTRNLIDSIEAFVPDALIDQRDDSYFVTHKGRTTKILTNRISFDVEAYTDRAAQPDVLERADALRKKYTGEIVIFDASRADPTKATAERVEAIDRLLEKHPDTRGAFRTIQAIAQGRSGIPLYDDYAQRVAQRVKEVNERWKIGEWEPIVQEGILAFPDLLARFKVARIGAVNARADGMNLVGKQYGAGGPADGILMLGEHVGAVEELAPDRTSGALVVNPLDTESFADAFDDALRMSEAERRARMDFIRTAVWGNTIYHYGDRAMKEFELARQQ